MLEWFEVIKEVILNLLLFFYKYSGNNLGFSIIAMTVVVNLLLWPLSKRMVEMSALQKELQPRLKELQKKYKDDSAQLGKEQLKLYKEMKFNPAAGCLPMILQMVLFIALISVFRNVLGSSDVVSKLNDAAFWDFLKINSDKINTQFLFFDLAKTDVFKIGKYSVPGFLVILSAVVQFFTSKAMLPSIKAEQKVSTLTHDQKDDMASDVQKQMAYIMPLMFLYFGMISPSGITLYFIISSLFTLLRYKSSSGKVSGIKRGINP